MKTRKCFPKKGRVKTVFLEFLYKNFGRDKVFGLSDAVKAGWTGSKNIRMTKLARDGYLKPMGKKKYRYVRGVKATNGQVVPRPHKAAKKAESSMIPLTPTALMADHAAKNGLIAYNKAEILNKMGEIRAQIMKLQEDEAKLTSLLEALEKLPDVREILSK